MATIFIHNHIPVIKTQLLTCLHTTDSYGSFPITRLPAESWKDWTLMLFRVYQATMK